MNSFFISQFNYCPLVWMCHIRLMNNKISRLHEKCLRMVCSEKAEELLYKDGSVTIHTRNLQVFSTDMFKVYKNFSATIVAETFRASQNNYNLRHSSFISIPYIKTVYHGLKVYPN